MQKGIKTNIDFEIRSPLLKGILYGLLFAVIMFFVIYPIAVFGGGQSTVKTSTAVKKTVYNTIDADAIAVREEILLENIYSGTVVPAVSNGSKVAIGDTVADIYSSEAAANNASRLLELKKETDYYNSVLSTVDGTLRADIDVYRSNVSDTLLSMSEIIEQENLSGIYEKSRELREAITKKQIATGIRVDVSEKLNSLNGELEALKGSAIPAASVTAEKAGYYVNTADGFESLLDFKNVKNIGCAEVDAALATVPSQVSVSNVGKLITDFNWYLVFNTETEKLGNITAGSTVTVSFTNSSVDLLNMKVEAINQNEADARVTLILSSNYMNEDIAALRQASIKIRVEAFTGLAVDRQAIRTVDGVKGVYVKVGNLADFRKIDIIYSDENFVLSSIPKKEDGSLEMYDNIILEGIDMYDSKLLG